VILSSVNQILPTATGKNAIPEMVAFKLMIWSWKLSDQERGGLTNCQFVRYHLMLSSFGREFTSRFRPK
jgi:hypothetical protein